MFVDLFKYPWVLRPPIEFTTVEELLERMPVEVIAPAEEKYQVTLALIPIETHECDSTIVCEWLRSKRNQHTQRAYARDFSID